MQEDSNFKLSSQHPYCIITKARIIEWCCANTKWDSSSLSFLSSRYVNFIVLTVDWHIGRWKCEIWRSHIETDTKSSKTLHGSLVVLCGTKNHTNIHILWFHDYCLRGALMLWIMNFSTSNCKSTKYLNCIMFLWEITHHVVSQVIICWFFPNMERTLWGERSNTCWKTKPCFKFILFGM